jgi:hypothetical protein
MYLHETTINDSDQLSINHNNLNLKMNFDGCDRRILHKQFG